jgi:hypothetical protein
VRSNPRADRAIRRERPRESVFALFAPGVLFMLAIAIAVPARAELDRPGTREDMREIYASIKILLPLSVDDAAFRSPNAREQINEALRNLAARAEHVGSHIAGDDRRIRFLGSALSRKTEEARIRFEEGRFESAQFLVRRLTDFCVACHTRMPSRNDSPLAQGFVSQDVLAKLPPAQRASIQVATRRFDDALATQESLFTSTAIQPAALLAPLNEYLRVSIRVKNDLERPRATLQKFAARPDLWSNLRADVEDWIAALDLYAKKPPAAASLDSARSLLEEAQSVLRFPTDRRALVQQFLASSELHRYLELHAGETNRNVAEAYYLLGLIESRTNFNFLVSESDFYLETAIRMAPNDPIGRAAFDLFEEEAVLGWTGSSGSRMPEDVRRNLEALRALVETAPANDSESG